MSRSQRKQVGKQVVRKRYRRVRYDLLVLGLILVVSGLLAYSIIANVTGGARPPEGAETGEDPLGVLRLFASAENLKNESVLLVYRVRGDVAADSYVLGTLDYVAIYVTKEVTTLNDTTRVAFASFMHAVQGPLHLIAEVLGLAFRAESIRDLFFNPTIRNTWINATVEELGERVEHLDPLGNVRVSSEVYRFYRVIEGRVRYIEVVALRYADAGHVPVKVEARVDSSRFSMELVSARRVS